VEGSTWTIAELTELAAEALAAAGPALTGPDGAPARANGRVRDIPTERLIRWYATVGLVDPPLSRQGRVAQYGPRHLLQLVAVKRRQAEGRSLARIQAELAGATDETLAAIAAIPRPQLAPAGTAPSPARFWARRPDQPPPAAASPAGLIHGVRLAPGVTLMLEDAGHEPSPAELAEIVDAARPLLRELASRGLLKGAGLDH
jgi:DNA-binding transcriptional MerR regulator